MIYGRIPVTADDCSVLLDVIIPPAHQTADVTLPTVTVIKTLNGYVFATHVMPLNADAY